LRRRVFPVLPFGSRCEPDPIGAGFSYRLCAASFRWFCYFRRPGYHDAHISEHFRPCGFASPTLRSGGSGLPPHRPISSDVRPTQHLRCCVAPSRSIGFLESVGSSRPLPNPKSRGF
jgi:hypothetical protein